MKNSVTRILSAFRLSDSITDSDERRVVARYSRGNVKLQLGQITTEKEYEDQKKRVLEYDLC